MGGRKSSVPSRVVLIAATLLLVCCVVLLLNITAPNPTGRRYSSEVPLTTGQASGGDIGADAERVLANDLGLPNNNDFGQRQCLCNSTQYATSPPGQCNVCWASSSRIGNFRIPDFVGNSFIGESKNVLALSRADENVYRQLRDMATVAEDAGLAFWVYVRVDTQVDGNYQALFDHIKGGIVYYFAVPGYVDPVDQIAQIGLLLALLVIVGTLFWRWVNNQPPRSPKPQVKTTLNPLRQADDVQEFARRMQDRARGHIDEPNGNE